MLALELEGIQALGRPVDGRTRLACQLTATGPIVVTKRGVHRIEG
jgi:ferredoxin, 2Fe-2S